MARIWLAVVIWWAVAGGVLALAIAIHCLRTSKPYFRFLVWLEWQRRVGGWGKDKRRR